jgi:casein kinase II subunit alpha
VLGTDSLRDYLRTYRLNLPAEAARLIKSCDVVSWSAFVNDKNKDRVNTEGLDLLSKMLVYDKNKRITPTEAMKHEYFAPIRAIME